MYQAGTFSGNPLATPVWVETRKLLKRDGFYCELKEKGVRLSSGIAEAGFVSIDHTDEDIEKTIAAALLEFKNL